MPDTHDIGKLFTHAAQLSPDAPVFHRALTAEYDDPCRHSNSVVVKTPFRRAGKWFGIRKSWISMQVKLPLGKNMASVWGIVIGWWRMPEVNEEWEALARATRLGSDPDERQYTAPTSASIRESVELIAGRRTDSADDDGPDGQ